MIRPLDIAIATKQNWANLVSILDRDGEIGDVLWVETPTARKAKWSQGCSEILRREHRVVLTPVEVSREAEGDPSILAACLDGQIDRGRELRLHLNGGTKLMQAVLSELAGPASIWHYVDGQRFHTRQGGQWSHRPLRLRPNLSDILLSYGFEKRDPGQQRLQLAGDLKVGGELHRAFMDKQARDYPDLAQGQRAGRWMGFSKNLEWLIVFLEQEGHASIPDRLREILKSPALLDDLFRAFHDKEVKRIGEQESQIRSLWFSFKKNLEWVSEVKNTWLHAPTGPSPAAIEFETQVADTLDRIRERWGVAETLRNLHLFPKGSDFSVAELDAVWVLPGGQVAIFECKLGTQDDKAGFRITLRSRAKAYEEALGIHARPFLVLPARPASNPKYLQPILQDMAEAAEDLGWKILLVPKEDQVGTSLEPFGVLRSLEDQLADSLPV